MTILFRYILREYAKIFLMCFSGLMTIYLVIDFFEKVRRFLKFDANMLDVLAYFALKTPAISFQITPLAILMATLLTLGLLSRNNEITAMRSCGISLTWIASPFLIFAAFISLILLSFSSTVIPLASEKSEEILLIRIEKKPAPIAVKAPRPWIRIGSRRDPASSPPLSFSKRVSAGPNDRSGNRQLFAGRMDALQWEPAAVSPRRISSAHRIRPAAGRALVDPRRLFDLAGRRL
jgi:lipopolysaccharide export LptBFGC system permease protein LptF